MSPYPENNLPHLEDSDMAKELVRYAYGLIASDTEDSKSRFPRFESEDGLASPQQRYTNEDLHRLFTATDDKTDHFCAWGKGLSRKCGELQKLCFEEINRNKGLYQAFKNLHTAKSLENTTLEAKISELRKSHIKSVNSVDAGTEPISDQELEDSVRRLHDEVRISSLAQYHYAFVFHIMNTEYSALGQRVVPKRIQSQ